MQEAFATLVDTHELALPNAKLCAEEFFKKKLPYMQFCFIVTCEKDKLFLAFYLILLFQGFDLCRVNTIFRLLLSASLTNLFSLYAIYLFIYFSTVLMWLFLFLGTFSWNYFLIIFKVVLFFIEFFYSFVHDFS